jgi:hypothetical protein
LSRSHACEAIEPSGSIELDANVTGSFVCGSAGVLVNAAVGARFATLIVRVEMCCAPLLSVTRSLTA